MQPKQISITKFHLINQSGELQPGLSDHMNSYKYGKDYAIISIIGSQSSGKSTLLNRLFETQFEVLNSQKERRQVTKGIWLASGIKSNLIVLDVEGSDSRERWDERHFYEQSTALFALALSQVLIINLWTHEVGRFSGSQYGILKVIFEMNIKLFGQDQLKQLVFILRDYSEIENFTEICELIRGDIHRIWNEISKPEEFKTKTPEQLFKIDFFKLHHMRYALNQFNEGVENLKQIFYNPQYPNYLLKNFDFTSNLLLQDIPLFAQQIWSTIKSNKDLNLPSEKIVIANMRCNQIQSESMELIAPDIKIFHKTNIEKQIYHQFGNDSKQILSKALKYYDENSAGYQNEVKLEKRIELENQVISKFYKEYEIQKKNLEQILLSQYIKKVEMISIGKGEMQDLMGTLNQTREETIQLFQSGIYKSQIKDNSWEIEEYVLEFKEIITQQQEIFVDKFLQFFLTKKEKEMRKEVQKIINANFFELDLTFWCSVEKACFEIVEANENNILMILQKSFQLETSESQEKLINFKDDFTQTIESELRRKCQDLFFYAMKKFKNQFERKENGAPINWRKIKEEEIEPRYTKSKENTLQIVNQFQFFKLNLSQVSGSPRKKETQGTILIEEDDFKKLISFITIEMEQEYNDALELHKAKAESPIPKWMWVLLFFFMYDEVFMWLQSSWFIYPTLLTIIFIAVSFSLGQKQLPLKIVKKIWKVINTNFGQQLYKLGALLGIV